MKNRVFISAPLTLIEKARRAAEWAHSSGCDVSSDWHDSNQTVETEKLLSTQEKIEIVDDILEQIKSSDMLVLLLDVHQNRYGHLVEYGIALGLGKKVFVLMPDELYTLPSIFLEKAIVIKNNDMEF